VSQQINLYNASFVPKREWLTGKSLALVTGLVYAGLMLSGSWATQQANRQAAAAREAQAQLKLAQEVLDVTRKATETRKPNAALQAEIDRTQRLYEMRNEVLAEIGSAMGPEEAKGTDGGRRGAGFGDYLTGLARQSREGLWLTGFTVTAGGSGMVLRGRTLDKGMLPEYVQRLNAEPAFAGKSFAGLQVDYREVTVIGEVKSTAVPSGPTSVKSTPAAVAGPQRFLEFSLLAEGSSVEPKL
jgi:hypothetical protein